MSSAAPPRALQPVLTTLVGMWALLQAFGNLAAANVNADEPVYVTAGWAYVHGDFSANVEHPPTAKLLMGVAQVIFGQGVLSARVAAGLCAIAGGILLYVWLRPEVGWVGALCGAGAWLLLPHGVTSGVRIDRFGLLNPFMVVFAIAAFAAGWRWFRRRSWGWLCVSAVCMGLSITSKVPSAVMIPAIILSPLLERPTRPVAGRLRTVLVSALVYSAIVAVVVVVVYLPAGLAHSLGEMIRFQLAHDEAGHLVVVGGVATTHPPWWANLLFSVEGMGLPAATVLAVGAVAAFFGADRALPTLLVGAVLLEWMFQFAVSSVALPHYYYDWVWLFCVLFGVGTAALLRIGCRDGPAGGGHTVARALVAASVVVALGSAAWTTVAIANERARDMALVLPTLDRLGVGSGGILVAGMAEWEYQPYLDGREVTTPGTPGVVAVATKESLRFPIDPAVRALIDAPASRFRRLELDDVTLYVDEHAAISPETSRPSGSPGSGSPR
ncbi:ArnT family glycosyltransferase [Herbiconiux ginsengi]|uniref:Dolichyl-phosphate-mannose-protein mannosyltransferase n=1 Tax=Herbiconiux ginsengi TaxID=381665 RepID=A0A1H3TJU3_9MICO|nr:glycosyltransferase family 39 protein [Herbiconiux ginsengi]SDZ50476.1 Dolichyl-phosphate-mannose-protein mannosyltransferase [Herbiconiux ginsengi]